MRSISKVGAETREDAVTKMRTDAIAETRVAVVGLGYVGLPLALRADRRGHPVVGLDLDQERVESLKRRHAPDFLSAPDAETVQFHKMDVSRDHSILAGADVYVICVPTPVSETHEPDLNPLLSATTAVASYLREGTLLVVESTVNPGVCDEILLPLIKKMTGLKAERDYLFAYCPERINPGDTKWDVRSIPRVLGAAGPQSAKAALAFYASIVDAPVHLMQNVKEAEAVKITENSFRDINIAFVNELAMSFKKLGIDVMRVLDGAATKPFGFMPHYPGCGVGGHCIPVDPYYLIAYARQNGFTHRFLETARDINNYMPFYTITLLEESLQEHGIHLPQARIALLGLSYKRNVPDERESPALVIKEELQHRGAAVRAYDPFLEERSTAGSLEAALSGADAALIATDHDVFATLTPEDFKRYGVSIVIDGRNCLNKEAFVRAGITYHGIGR
jgi:UDP-N-acetyl-D-glucosamine dehydrogenase